MLACHRGAREEKFKAQPNFTDELIEFRKEEFCLIQLRTSRFMSEMFVSCRRRLAMIMKI